MGCVVRRGEEHQENLHSKINEPGSNTSQITRTSGPTMNLDTAPETAPAIPESSAAGRAEYCCPLDDFFDVFDVEEVVRRPPPIARYKDSPRSPVE